MPEIPDATALELAIDKLRDVPPQTRIEVVRGVNIRAKKNGLVVMSLHYSAIPSRDPQTVEGAEWYKRENGAYSSQAMWKKEQEIDPYATGGEAVFGGVLANPKLYEMVIISDPLWHPDPRWDVVGSFDHGVTNATALLKGYVPRTTINPVTGQSNPPELYLAGEFYRYRSDEWSNNIDENVVEMRKMPDLERARWIKADPSIFSDQVVEAVGDPTAVYKTYKTNGMWPMSGYGGVRSDVSFVEWIMSDYWKGLARGMKPRLYIVCRNPSDRPQPGLHEYDCPNLLWEMKRAKRVQMTATQLLTKNASEALQNKNNHLLDCAKYLTGTLRSPTQIPFSETIEGELGKLDLQTAPFRARYLFSEAARTGKLTWDGKLKTKKSAPRIDLKRHPGTLPVNR